MQDCQNCQFGELEQTEVSDAFEVDHHTLVSNKIGVWFLWGFFARSIWL
jgi:hypothetical protein